MIDELWKPAAGFENLYEASNQGRVRRVAPYQRGYGCDDPLPRLLKPMKNQNGYLRVALSGGAQPRSYRSIHSLVLATFIGPRPLGYQVNHIDRNITNNHLSNLEYVTAQGNTDHKRSGAAPYKNMPRGTSHHNSKLNPEKIRQIRERLALREPITVIAASYGITDTTVAQVRDGKTWRHVI